MPSVEDIRDIKLVINPSRLDKRIAFIFMMAGAASLFFLVVKAATTGFWQDEGWLGTVLYSNLIGKGWQNIFQVPANTAFGSPVLRYDPSYFPPGLFVSTGPTLLIPAVIVTLLLGKIIPPVLHLLVLAHSLLIWLALKILKIEKKAAVLSIFLILAALTHEVNMTQFLGEYPGACWFALGLALVSLAMDNAPLHSKYFFLSGLCFGFAVLSKLMFIIPLVPLYAVLLFLEHRQWRRLMPMLFTILLPVLLWHLYQLYHVGSWRAYTDNQREWFEIFVYDKQSGAGITMNKSASQMKTDAVRFFICGPAYFAAGCFAIAAGLVSKKLSPPLITKWIFFSWVSAGVGIFWWVFRSISGQYSGLGANYRHAAGFVVIALVPASYLLFNFMQKLVTGSFVNSRIKSLIVFALLISSIAVVGMTGYRSWVYFFKRKGVGLYSSWSDQNQLAKWIGLYGKPDVLLPVINCDSKLSVSMLVSHIQFAQYVVSNGMYRTAPCSEASDAAKTGGPLVFFDGQSAVSSFNVPYVLKEGDADGQGLWVAKDA